MSTVITSGASCQPTGCAQKHRACDECRTRKLACTKEPDGCSRCKREGIACHYSPQKQMGRPRKRPRDEASDEAADDATTTTTTTTTNDVPANKTVMIQTPPDTQDPGMSLINFLTAGDCHINLDAPIDPPAQDKGFSWSFGYAGDSLGDVGFDPEPHTESPFSINIDPSLLQPASDLPSLDPPPNLTFSSTTTPESTESSRYFISTPTPPATVEAATVTTTTTTTKSKTCAHTAALYLALESMQNPPDDVENAIRHARKATRTAYDAVHCPVCSFRIDPGDFECGLEMMRVFQNLMLVAALIPSIVQAYQRILALVDVEARRAMAEQRRLVFRLRGLGGILWGAGRPGLDREDECAFDDRDMEPALWRLAVRALLRADIYGLSDMEAVEADAPLHIGLKDIVLQMEQKCRQRHAVMDALLATGRWQPPCLMLLRKPDETPTCQTVVKIAKSAIDALVIA
ncbi:uncharacterized protein F4812DRAFT_460469 [Daldinia caldariorum]|uniref:uncharacterized protein n=1 Tax=Daldinia caldariorum TaxID=326644 RepID=UPI002007B822|nr:uncharacterized protein F4812DRAFT_460469 [Daldinia caldariorum]KAI1466911.1 hypothetical protein F4812DRAFT_460469 [Daldinia caldariorum]